MDEQQLATLENEIGIIKRIVNGFIALNPELADIELKGLSFKKKMMHNMDAGDAGVEEMEPLEGPVLEASFCKICLDANGEPYMYCFPGPCPVL